MQFFHRLFRGKHGGLCLVAVVHGFNQNCINAAGKPRTQRLLKERNGIFKIKVTHRLEQLAAGADVQRNVVRALSRERAFRQQVLFPQRADFFRAERF